MLQHKFLLHLHTSLDFGMNKRMKASTWKKMNASSTSASTSLTLCCFQIGMEFGWEEGLRTGRSVKRIGNEKFESLVWARVTRHMCLARIIKLPPKNETMKLPLCIKTTTSYKINVGRKCTNLFHKFVFNQQRLRWRALIFNTNVFSSIIRDSMWNSCHVEPKEESIARWEKKICKISP